MGLFGRLGNAFEIFTTSWKFLGRDRSLIIVPVLMVLSCILLFIPFIILLMLTEGAGLLLTAILTLFFAYFWFTFLGAAQVWMVHEVAQGKDTTLASGFKRAIHNLGDILAYAAVMLVVKTILSKMRQKGGVIGRAGAGFLELIVGIAGRLVLPAMIITDRNFKDSVVQLKDALKSWPEIAAYEVGIRPLTSLALLLGFGISALFWISGLVIPAIVIFVIWILLLNVVTIFINQTYYTLLYLTAIEKKKVKGVKL